MKTYIEKNDFDMLCTYKVNEYLRDNKPSEREKYIEIYIDDYNSLDNRTTFYNKSLKDVLCLSSFVEFIRSSELKNCMIKLMVNNLQKKNKTEVEIYYCENKNNEIVFFDEYNNEIKFCDKEKYIISKINMVKRIKNEIKYPTLQQYIDEVKSCEIMKAFKHCVNLENGEYIEIYFGSAVKTYLSNDEITEEDLEYYFDKEIRDVNLCSNY